MATVIASLLISTIILFRPVTSAGIDYRGVVAQAWPTATAYSPMVPQPGPKVTSTARIHRAQLQKRQLANSVCGYYEWSGEWLPVTCSYGISCVADQTLVPVAAFCSAVGSGGVPYTAAFDYGSWPIGGCIGGDGQLCCPENYPYWGEVEWNDGATYLYGCDTTHYTIFATTSIPSSITSTTFTTPSPTTTTTSSTTSFVTTSLSTTPISSTTSSSTTSPISTTPAPDPSPAVNTPANTNTGSNGGLDTSDKIALGVGVPCGIGSIVYLYRGFIKHKWGL